MFAVAVIVSSVKSGGDQGYFAESPIQKRVAKKIGTIVDDALVVKKEDDREQRE